MVLVIRVKLMLRIRNMLCVTYIQNIYLFEVIINYYLRQKFLTRYYIIEITIYSYISI